MSNHFGPEGTAPDELRCEALVRGTGRALYWEWTRHDRRCARKANQCRQGISVCYIHAKTPTLVRFIAPVGVSATKPQI